MPMGISCTVGLSSGLRQLSTTRRVGSRAHARSNMTEDCSHSYEICELLQVFDPSFVSEQGESINSEWVRRLRCVKPLAPLVNALVRDLHLYVPTTRGFTCNRSSVSDFTDSVLLWWRSHHSEVGAWAEAARIAFAFTPNSASAERTLSLLKNLFGDRHDSANADMIQASMMMRYNKREL